ncbi:MAG: hypothetical protein OYH76_18285 [Defluviicoccus sp.]|nr:hypothetical protein [Defluviicoccus sp.]MDE0277848.1 hypothetical protein [Defluviicoccus sp.]
MVCAIVLALLVALAWEADAQVRSNTGGGGGDHITIDRSTITADGCFKVPDKCIKIKTEWRYDDSVVHRPTTNFEIAVTNACDLPVAVRICSESTKTDQKPLPSFPVPPPPYIGCSTWIVWPGGRRDSYMSGWSAPTGRLSWNYVGVTGKDSRHACISWARMEYAEHDPECFFKPEKEYCKR